MRVFRVDTNYGHIYYKNKGDASKFAKSVQGSAQMHEINIEPKAEDIVRVFNEQLTVLGVATTSPEGAPQRGQEAQAQAEPAQSTGSNVPYTVQGGEEAHMVDDDPNSTDLEADVEPMGGHDDPEPEQDSSSGLEDVL